jgi:hypothetical protein
MRDHLGRYVTLKDVTKNGPASAKGCDKCKFGIVSAPELTNTAPFVIERVLQMLDEEIVFCTCEAGQHQKVYLLNENQKMIEQDRKNALIITTKIAGSDEPITPQNKLKIDSPIGIARNAINAARANYVPRIHYDGTAVRGPKDDE